MEVSKAGQNRQKQTTTQRHRDEYISVESVVMAAYSRTICKAAGKSAETSEKGFSVSVREMGFDNKEDRGQKQDSRVRILQ